MKNTLRLSATLILTIVFSIAAFAQYTGSNPNVAAGKLVVASDSIDLNKPGLAVDSDPMTYASIPGDAPAWIMVDLAKYYFIDGYGVAFPNAGELAGAYTFQVSEDGGSWTDVVSRTVTTSSTVYFDLTETDPVRYVRFYMTAKDALASFAEIVVYGEELAIPDAPETLPATLVTNASFYANWTAETGATGYVLSVALDEGFTTFPVGWDEYGIWVGDFDTYQVTGLDPGTVYYYRVRAFNLAGTSNFGIKSFTTTLQGAQTITFDALSAMTYGDADFDLTATASSGLDVSYASSDETVATISGSTVAIVGVGTTTITASQDGDAQYTAAAPVSQDLVVGAKALTVTGAEAADKVYDGTTDAVISGATLDGLVGDDDVTLDGAAAGTFAQAGVGTDIAVTVAMGISGADEDKYDFTAPTGFAADITPAELTVIADDKTREECAVNPDFTLSYAGFITGETVSVIDVAPTVSCDADASSADGDYVITVTGGQDDNYIFTYVNGTLTVSPDATNPTLIVKNATVNLDENDLGSIAAADVVNEASDNCTLADTTLSQSDFTLADVGTVNVDVTVTDETGNTTTETALVVVNRTTGIADRDALNRFYPNPTSGVVHIDLNTMAEELVVMDMTGKTVLRQVNVEKDALIDLSEFQSGIYVFQLKFGDNMKQFKVVKN